jgi:dTDP-4-amino-4,6-dideoxygalactose transaminase
MLVIFSSIRVPLKEMEISRNEMLLELRARNIGASIHYPPIHTLPLYQPYVKMSLPNVEQLMNDIMTLPIGASVTDEDVNYVTDHVLEMIEAARK